ncbi:Fur-regulated basic protein FbpA [Siminovitchia sp. 179-K 8D1 HS]|uniref:Fur-regulated basic protein FbpA n=1 Tax=Siminovitchia sp. 179-K 8D1 HS TaxID=3142385 RepID=UPI0039A33181
MAQAAKSRRKELIDQLTAIGILKKENLLELSLSELENEYRNIHPHSGINSIRWIRRKK